MNNKLNIALKCTKYLLVAALVALPFLGLGETEAKAQPEFTQAVVADKDCPTGESSWCYRNPGRCPSGGWSCLMDEIVVYG